MQSAKLAYRDAYMDMDSLLRRSFGIAIASLLLIVIAVAIIIDAARPVTDPFFLDAPDRLLNDADVAAIATLAHDAKSDRHSWLRLGVHRGVRVVDQHICGDICPDYTVGIVRYDVEAGTGCTKVGGITVDRFVPGGASIDRKAFCLPAPLAIAECNAVLAEWLRTSDMFRKGWPRPDSSDEGLRSAVIAL